METTLLTPWLTVVIGLVELALPLAVFTLLAWEWRRRGPTDPAGIAWPWLVALFGTALAVQFHAGGTSPRIWIDAVNDERWVRACLDGGACPTTGVMTSMEPLRHAVGWLRWRTALDALGAGPEGTQVFLHGLAALGVVATAMAGARLAGPFGGLVAAAGQCRLALWLVKSDALYNGRVLVALGALALTLGLRAVETRRLRDLFLLAACAAAAANVHIVGALFGTLVLAVALLGDDRRRAGLAGLGLFVGLTLVEAPGAWSRDLASLLAGLPSPRSATGPGAPLDPLDGVAILSAVGLLVTWFAQRRTPDRGARLAVVAGFLVPAISVVEGSRLLGATEPTLKYLAPWLPGMMVGGVAFAAWLVGFARGWTLRLPRMVSTAALGLPLLALGAVAVQGRDTLGSEVGQARTGLPALKTTDVDDLARVFRDRGWDLGRVARDVRTPEAATFLGALDLSMRPGPASPGNAAPGGAIVLKLWGDGDAAPVFLTDPWIAWGALRACLVGARGETTECVDGPTVFRADLALRRGDGPGRLPGRPGTTEGRLVVTVPARIPAGAGVHELHLPAMAGVCPGRVVLATPSIPDPSGCGRAALLVAGAEPAEVELVLEWDLADPVCARWGYDGTLPFLVEADVGTVADLKARLAPFEEE